MDHAITVGEVATVFGWLILVSGVLAVFVGVLAFMAKGWDH